MSKLKLSLISTLQILFLTFLFSSCGKDVAHSVAGLYGPCISPAIAITSDEGGQEVGINSSALGGDEIAQTFKVSKATLVYFFQLKLIRVGTPSAGKITLNLQTDSNGQPDGTNLATSSLTVAHVDENTTLLVQDLSTTATFYYFTIDSSTALSLDPTKTYWLRIQASYRASDTNLVKWLANNSNIYTQGQGNYKNSSGNWISTDIGSNRDFLFILGGGC